MSTENPAMNPEEVAVLLGKAPRSVSQDIKRNPDSVPPRLIIPGSRRLLWRTRDVLAWPDALPITAQAPASCRVKGVF